MKKLPSSINPAISNFDQTPDGAHCRPIVCAQLLGVSIATFWRLVKQGKLQTHKLTPRTTSVKARDLRSFMAGEKVEG